jgi:hypothetical protein
MRTFVHISFKRRRCLVIVCKCQTQEDDNEKKREKERKINENNHQHVRYENNWEKGVYVKNISYRHIQYNLPINSFFFLIEQN